VIKGWNNRVKGRLPGLQGICMISILNVENCAPRFEKQKPKSISLTIPEAKTPE